MGKSEKTLAPTEEIETEAGDVLLYSQRCNAWDGCLEVSVSDVSRTNILADV